MPAIVAERLVSEPRRRLVATGADPRPRPPSTGEPLTAGSLTPDVLDRLPGRGVRRLMLADFPAAGVHIDVPGKTVGAWQTFDALGMFAALPAAWDGWQVECWQDRYEDQLTACGRALQLPALEAAEAIDGAQAWIHARVFRGCWDIDELVFRRRRSGLRCWPPVQPSAAQWARFVAACDVVRGVPARSA